MSGKRMSMAELIAAMAREFREGAQEAEAAAGAAPGSLVDMAALTDAEAAEAFAEFVLDHGAAELVADEEVGR